MSDVPIIWDDAKMLKASETFTLASSKFRLQILATLAIGEMIVSDLTTAMGYGQSTTSSQLKLLLVAGAVEGNRRGMNRTYRLTDKGRVILKAAAMFASFPA